jgi:hypothetical protein
MVWLGLTALYLSLAGVGLLLGHWLADRFRRDGGLGPELLPAPVPTGPRHGAAWHPLGSAFDRAFLPAAFAGETALEPV